MAFALSQFMPKRRRHANKWAKFGDAILSGAASYAGKQIGSYGQRKIGEFFHKRKSRRGVIAYSGSDPTDFSKEINSSYNVITMGSKRRVRSMGRWSYLYQNQGQVVVNAGNQGVADMAFHGHIVGQYLSNSGATGIVNAATWKDNPFTLNPFQTNTGSANVFTSVVQPSNDIIFLESCMASMQIVNSSNTPVVCDIYWCVPRIGLRDGPTVTWINSLADAAMGQPSNINPTSSVGALTVGAPLISTYGQSPAYERTFRELYNIKLRKKIILQGGSSHDIRYKIWFNKFLHRSTLEEKQTTGIAVAPGISLVPMIVARPGPVVFREGADIAANDQGYTTSNGKVGWTYTHRYVYRAVPEHRLSINRAAAQFVALVPDGSTKHLKFIDTEDSVVSTEVT